MSTSPTARRPNFLAWLLPRTHPPSTALPDAEARFARLRATFESLYGRAPALYARAPGRVNLIGEHIDYEGYSVLPMAIALDTVVAIAPSTAGALRVANVSPDTYPAVSLAADPSAPMPPHCWASYVLCAHKGVGSHLGGAFPPGGFDLLVDGRVPPGAGVSSSSALVCASMLALLAIQGASPPAAAVAQMACECERHSGTQSGGMDQAISLLAQRGTAKLVHFAPVRTEDVALPPGAVFVVANSLTVSTKAETAHTRYNARVLECRLASAALALALGAPRDRAVGPAFRTLRAVEALLPPPPPPAAAADNDQSAAAGGREAVLARALAAAGAHLKAGRYSVAEVEALLGAPLSELLADSPASLQVVAHNGGAGFALRDRAQHVFSEAARVEAFARLCNGGGGTDGTDGTDSGGTDDLVARLGRLMDASHASCRDRYQCSCDELEELVGALRAAGAAGARLTGAGWGGCAVALLRDASALAGFLDRVDAAFYAPRRAGGAAPADRAAVLFATLPAAGACVLLL